LPACACCEGDSVERRAACRPEERPRLLDPHGATGRGARGAPLLSRRGGSHAPPFHPGLQPQRDYYMEALTCTSAEWCSTINRRGPPARPPAHARVPAPNASRLARAGWWPRRAAPRLRRPTVDARAGACAQSSVSRTGRPRPPLAGQPLSVHSFLSEKKKVSIIIEAFWGALTRAAAGATRTRPRHR
jgi:hypothetical protein